MAFHLILFWAAFLAAAHVTSVSFKSTIRELRGVFPEKLGGGVQPTSQNPCFIYDQNLLFSLPYLWPGEKFDTLFMTVAAQKVALDIIYEGILLMVLLTMVKKLHLLRNIPNSRLECKNQPYLWSKWPKSIPYLWPNRLKNQTLWGHTYLYSPIRE